MAAQRYALYNPQLLADSAGLSPHVPLAAAAASALGDGRLLGFTNAPPDTQTPITATLTSGDPYLLCQLKLPLDQWWGSAASKSTSETWDSRLWREKRSDSPLGLSHHSQQAARRCLRCSSAPLRFFLGGSYCSCRQPRCSWLACPSRSFKFTHYSNPLYSHGSKLRPHQLSRVPNPINPKQHHYTRPHATDKKAHENICTQTHSPRRGNSAAAGVTATPHTMTVRCM